MTANTPKRLLALDILRGITIAGMILVNNPGSWGHVYTPLEHAAFNGLTALLLYGLFPESADTLYQSVQTILSGNREFCLLQHQ